MKMKQQRGFTLIELVLVIVILGILAAAALPRFSDLSTEARVATLNGLAGSLRSAAAIAKATQLAQNRSAGESVTIEGQTITMSGRYPTADSNGIENAISDFTGFTHNGAGVFTLVAGCTVTYTNAGGGTFSVTIASGSC
jgi:MSHA pilin protein MshA